MCGALEWTLASPAPPTPFKVNLNLRHEFLMIPETTSSIASLGSQSWLFGGLLGLEITGS